jgi:hypothetical protein
VRSQVIRILQEPEHAARLRENARSTVEQSFRLDQMVDRIAEDLDKVVATPR